MTENRLQISPLIGCTSSQIVSTSFEEHLPSTHLISIGRLCTMFVVSAHKVPLDIIRREFGSGTRNAIKQHLKRTQRSMRSMLLARHSKLFASTDDFHAQNGFHLPEILVERTA